jgi:cell fate (sporulation/competence/biofilm development) regulator YlbF (YheA/YmcA/DUF963 family)
MSKIITDLDRKINETRSLMHYYRKKTTPLDKAKAKGLEDEFNKLKEEKRKIIYNKKVTEFLKDHPEMSYMFEDENPKSSK